jgi:hypothetical protein
MERISQSSVIQWTKFVLLFDSGIIPSLSIGCNFRCLSCRCECSGGYVAVHRWCIKLFFNQRNVANRMICEIHVVNI